MNLYTDKSTTLALLSNNFLIKQSSPPENSNSTLKIFKFCKKKKIIKIVKKLKDFLDFAFSRYLNFDRVFIKEYSIFLLKFHDYCDIFILNSETLYFFRI